MVKFWDLRKTDKPSWQLTAPSPGAPQQVLTPTPKARSKVCVSADSPFLCILTTVCSHVSGTESEVCCSWKQLQEVGKRSAAIIESS